MSKIIQQIKISEVKSLYIIDFDEKTDELTFRTSDLPQQLHNEIVEFKPESNLILTERYNFHIHYLQNFINQNKNHGK